MAKDRSASYGTRDHEKELSEIIRIRIISQDSTVSDMEPKRNKKKGTATEHLVPRPGCRSQADRNGMGQLVPQNRQCWRAGPCTDILRGRGPNQKTGALRGRVLINTNYPVDANMQLKEKTANSVITSYYL